MVITVGLGLAKSLAMIVFIVGIADSPRHGALPGIAGGNACHLLRAARAGSATVFITKATKRTKATKEEDQRARPVLG